MISSIGLGKGHRFNPKVLRAADIRGPVGKTLSEVDAYVVGRSFATLIGRGNSRVVVGHDGRLSSPSFEAALVDGLIAGGVEVLRVGLGPTSMVYYAAEELAANGGIMVTASHNPAPDNGFKIVRRGRPFSVGRLAEVAAAGQWIEGKGTARHAPIMDAYVDRLLQNFGGAAHRVGWDAGNGAAGPVVERLIARLPGEHHSLFTEVDGRFPNHHPDPADPRNLGALRTLVTERRLDFGFGFDGDGDRIGAVDGAGRIVYADELLMLLAEPVLAARPGATIIADVKASDAFFDRVRELGGVPLMWKTGNNHISSKMRETGAPLAGELSGHIFFAHDYYGFDDALYAAVKLIEASSGANSFLGGRSSLNGRRTTTPEIRLATSQVCRTAVLKDILEWLQAGNRQFDQIDGVRVKTEDGWWLLRESQTEEALVVRAEAASDAGLRRTIGEVEAQLALAGVSADLWDACRH